MKKLRYYQGMTLIELMIVVAILSIIAAVAFNQFGGQQDKGYRGEGVNLLMQAVQEFEGCGRDSGGDFSACNITTFAISTSGRFATSVVSTPSTYMITLARASGVDDQCTTMSINHLGQKFFTSNDGSGTVARCWSGTGT